MKPKSAFTPNHNVPVVRSGFTLIELLVTVSVMATLAGLIMVNIYGNLAKGRDAKRKNDLREIRTSLELYFSINNTYPPSDSGWPPYTEDSGTGLIKGCILFTNPLDCPWGSPFVQDSVTYMSSLPKDPKGDQSYFYQRDPDGDLSYILVAKLERPNDPDLTTSQASCANVFSTTALSFDPSWYVICDSQ